MVKNIRNAIVLGFIVNGYGFIVRGYRFIVTGSWLRVRGSGFGVQSLELRVSRSDLLSQLNPLSYQPPSSDICLLTSVLSSVLCLPSSDIRPLSSAFCLLPSAFELPAFYFIDNRQSTIGFTGRSIPCWLPRACRPPACRGHAPWFWRFSFCRNIRR
jgi:hypothetical protein